MNMLLYPDIQARAQTELDSVFTGRLPTFEDNDEESLPYITALIKELLRYV